LSLNASLGEALPFALEDLIVMGVLKWFKTSFFSWMDNPKCSGCGNKATKLLSAQAPTPEERQYGAGRTEVYNCPSCSASTRFPRYNDQSKLLETRTGRCGEWANCFLLFLRAIRVDARYILDVTDHVWCEYWSFKLDRWVHLDPCEAAFDKPLLYSLGWGKKLSYVFAIGTTGFADVARRYARDWQDVQSRRKMVSESDLEQRLSALNATVRAGLPQETLVAMEVRDMSEKLELLEFVTRASLNEEERIAAESLPGRTTGALEWRQGRGELGSSSAAAATSSKPPPASATSYALAPDVPSKHRWLFDAFKRIRGGACRASGENSPSESASCAFDSRPLTKWLDFNGGGVGGSSWIEFRLPKDVPALTLAHYDLVSANDSPERDPFSWQLLGLVEESDGSGSWATLDEREQVEFGLRFQLMAFEVPVEKRRACRAFKLNFTSTLKPSEANSLQLACCNLYSSDVSASIEEAVSAITSPSCGIHQVPGATSTLMKLLGNIAEHPGDHKFKKVRASRIQAHLLDHPQVVQLLSLMGFRPLIIEEEDAFVLFSEGTRPLEALKQVHSILKATLPVT
jgi:peptide-N4-(N-acetyl-beta-glucosaminyl)asparagine amidase